MTKDEIIEAFENLRYFESTNEVEWGRVQSEADRAIEALKQGQLLPIDSVSGCFPSEKEVEQAAESFGNLYSQDPNFANGCEAGWNAGANWMKEKYKDSNNR